MRLLVSSPRQVLAVDAETHEVQIVENHRREYYGLSWTTDGQQICFSHSGIENSAVVTIEDYMESEQGRISIANRTGPITCASPHQILCTDEYVLVTNTGRNCITRIRLEDNFFMHHWFDKCQWDRKGRSDRCGSHFNSLYLRDQKLYVLAHNHAKNSYVLTASWPDLELISSETTSAQQAHNVWVTADGDMFICDTKNGNLIEGRTGEIVWSANEPLARTRGLACSGDTVFIGKSLQSDRWGRAHGDGGIWVVDRRTWTTIDEIVLPAVGNVHEIRILDAIDECHHQILYQGELQVDRGSTDAYRQDQGLQLPELDSVCRSSQFAPRWRTRTSSQGSDGANGVANVVATVDGSNATDAQVSATVDLSQDHAQFSGVVVRYRGPADRNLVAGHVTRSNNQFIANIWANVDGNWMRLAASPIGKASGTLTLVARADRLELFFDEVLVASAACPQPLMAAGDVGVRYRGIAPQTFAVRAA